LLRGNTKGSRRGDAAHNKTTPRRQHGDKPPRLTAPNIEKRPKLSKRANDSTRDNNLLMRRLKSVAGALVFKGKPARASFARPGGSPRDREDYLSVLLF
jgi:hypothetical protein